ncbi:MAG TPA: hypothetical protein DCS91_02515 [Microcoleaceae bacterium UBA11344]|nr:hypothetical protein [Microcoleaceae cyanobacterium UBA11344]
MVRSAIKLQIFLSEGCSGKLNLLPFAERITLRPPEPPVKTDCLPRLYLIMLPAPNPNQVLFILRGQKKVGKWLTNLGGR